MVIFRGKSLTEREVCKVSSVFGNIVVGLIFKNDLKQVGIFGALNRFS